jgi:ribosomal-protein-alanine N-acetyltransferase
LSSPAARDWLDEVETQRLRMRPLSEDDASLYCNICEDPDAMRFVGRPLSPERAQRSFRKALESLDCCPLEQLFLVVVDKASQEAIGISALTQFDARRRRVQAGIMLTSESRGRGFGKEILRAMVTRAFGILPVDEVWVQHARANAMAQSLPVSLGFSRQLDAVDYGEEADKCIWSVARETQVPQLEVGPSRLAGMQKS